MSQYSAAGLRYNVVTQQQRAATRPAIRTGARATRRAVRERHGLGRDTILYRDWGKKVALLPHGAPTRTCAQRHDRGTPATRPGGGHDTVLCVPQYSPARTTTRRVVCAA